jgi:hypothetical protein
MMSLPRSQTPCGQYVAGEKQALSEKQRRETPVMPKPERWLISTRIFSRNPESS